MNSKDGRKEQRKGRGIGMNRADCRGTAFDDSAVLLRKFANQRLEASEKISGHQHSLSSLKVHWYSLGVSPAS